MSISATNPVSQEQEQEQPTCSHEESWVFSQVSQWGSNWAYSSNNQTDEYNKKYADRMNIISSMIMNIRTFCIKNNIPPRVVHYAQILLWRFYLKENPDEYPFIDIIPHAFESACLILETKSVKELIASSISGHRNTEKISEFENHFKLVTSLDYSFRIYHPSDYLHKFFNQHATEKQIQLAECIISDSYLCPCCLVHKPERIAEGAAIMAAGMTNSTNSAIPKSQEALSFVRDMQFFYTQSMRQYSK